MNTATAPAPKARSTPRPALNARPGRPIHYPLGSARFRHAMPAVQPEYAAKIVLDYVLAFAVAIIALPILAVAAALVKLTSRGPAIYAQSRVGHGGLTFTIYKLRTMWVDCEAATGPKWSTTGDSRITPLGKILRALHIDELPQLWNVFRGEMSLIGPRPERPEIVGELRRHLRGYDARHRVRPGITGFAQVHLPPDSCLQTVKNKMVYDRFYLTRQGLWLDLRILACTALKVVGLQSLYRRRPRLEVL